MLQNSWISGFNAAGAWGTLHQPRDSLCFGDTKVMEPINSAGITIAEYFSLYLMAITSYLPFQNGSPASVLQDNDIGDHHLCQSQKLNLTTLKASIPYLSEQGTQSRRLYIPDQ